MRYLAPGSDWVKLATVLLGLETATPTTILALVEGGRLLAAHEAVAPGKHETTLLPALEALLHAAGRSKRALRGVGVGTGPGGFTSLRVGIATAKGLALGLGVPLAGVCSLRVLARTAALREPGAEGYASLVDARRGEVYLAAFDGAFGATVPAAHLPLGEALDALVRLHPGGRGLVLAGDALGPHAEALRAALPEARLGPAAPSADALGREVEEAFARGEAREDETLEAQYLRPPDAALPKVPLRVD